MKGIVCCGVSLICGLICDGLCAQSRVMWCKRKRMGNLYVEHHQPKADTEEASYAPVYVIVLRKESTCFKPRVCPKSMVPECSG